MSVDPGSRGWNEHRHLPGPVPLNAGVTLRAGVGAPSSPLGGDGDVYFRKDGGTGTTIYQKRAGVWVAVA